MPLSLPVRNMQRSITILVVLLGFAFFACTTGAAEPTLVVEPPIAPASPIAPAVGASSSQSSVPASGSFESTRSQFYDLQGGFSAEYALYKGSGCPNPNNLLCAGFCGKGTSQCAKVDALSQQITGNWKTALATYEATPWYRPILLLRAWSDERKWKGLALEAVDAVLTCRMAVARDCNASE